MCSQVVSARAGAMSSSDMWFNQNTNVGVAGVEGYSPMLLRSAPAGMRRDVQHPRADADHRHGALDHYNTSDNTR